MFRFKRFAVDEYESLIRSPLSSSKILIFDYADGSSCYHTEDFKVSLIDCNQCRSAPSNVKSATAEQVQATHTAEHGGLPIWVRQTLRVQRIKSQLKAMEIPSKKVYEVLKSNGVDEIFHANSVITSCQFLRKRALLSRGTVARSGLYQTAQKSDQTDQKFGIRFDVFADSDDIHHRAKKANMYGSGLFVLDIELIASAYTGKVWVTKLNPTKWNGKTHQERWFVSVKDLEDNFVKGRFDQMIVFRHCGGELSIQKYLKKVIVDDPCLTSKQSNVDYYSMAYGALQLSMTEGQVNAPIIKRRCPKGCICQTEYSDNSKRTKEMYAPKIYD